MTGQTSYANDFKNTHPGSVNVHARNAALQLWGANGTDLSGGANLAVTRDVDGDSRVRPDIGADEISNN